MLLVELNEANFELIQKYIYADTERNKWPTIRKIINYEGVHTNSEPQYNLLEPWIQWVSVHTGLEFSDHKVFHLGDITNFDHKQVFEKIENSGYTVGAVSPMNTQNLLRRPAFFIPDPWTQTEPDNSKFSNLIHKVLVQVVNDNSKGKITLKSILVLLYALVFKTTVSNWLSYARLAFKSRKNKWCKALFLDLLLSDIFKRSHKNTRPDFSVIFLNAFAHIQHHYFFNSKYYDGPLSNPDWYCDVKDDPFVDALDVYEKILSNISKISKNEELVIATGLRQIPYSENTYYYRLRDHRVFLEQILDVEFKVYPRMTRDFSIKFTTANDASEAANILAKITINNTIIFGSIEQKDTSLFVTLTHSEAIVKNTIMVVDEKLSVKANDHLVFVAIKNGMHDQLGYVFSSKPGDFFKKLDGRHVCNLHDYFVSQFPK